MPVDLLSRARQVAPQIAAAAARIESEGQLPGDLVAALHQAQLYRALLPRDFGGEEVQPEVFVQFMEILAAADASTAWCVGQNSGCSMVSAYMDPAAATAIWGADPDAALAWGFGPQGTARVVPGGYRVTGSWQFASGGHNATWLGGHSHVQEPDGTMRRAPSGAPVERTMLFPQAAVTWTKDWQVIGLRGTGSDSYAVADLFIPEAHSVARDNPGERRHPGRLYRFSTTSLYAASFGGVALGIARATLDAFKALAGGKTASATSGTLRENPVIQAAVARAEARLGAARAYLLTTLETIWRDVETTGAPSLDQRMQIRLAATFASTEARAVVDMAYHQAGSTAVFQANPFERRFRDMNSVSQQVQARDSHFETVGAHLLGLEANLRHV